MAGKETDEKIDFIKHAKLELFTEWRDESCQGPACLDYPHPSGFLQQDSRYKSELAIQWWNLSEEFDTYSDGEILDIRILVEDEVEDPKNESSSGRALYNWARSECILDQILYNPEMNGGERQGASENEPEFHVVAAFINNNPYDSQPKLINGEINPAALKRVHYSGNTTDEDTAFIYVRDSSGKAELDFYIALSTEKRAANKWEVFPGKILVKFYSSEDEVPPNMEEDPNSPDNWVYAYAYPFGNPSDYNDDVFNRIVSLLHTDEDEDELAPDKCLIYHTRLIVSDSVRSCSNFGYGPPPDCIPPVLYVSSRDHKWEYDGNKNWDKRMDFAVTSDRDHSTWDLLGRYKAKDFSFGKNRGRGRTNPDSDKKHWYSCDEFITSGGIEIVYAYISAPDNLRGKGGTSKVAVQSEADILIVTAHGSNDGSFGVKPDPDYDDSAYFFVYPYYDDIPNIFPSRDAWDLCHRIHDPVTPDGGYSDYLSKDHPYYLGNAWGHEKSGNFWQKRSSYSELRWLTLFTCDSLSDSGVGLGNWVGKIGNRNDSPGSYFLNSVCGYSGTIGYLTRLQNSMVRECMRFLRITTPVTPT